MVQSMCLSASYILGYLPFIEHLLYTKHTALQISQSFFIPVKSFYVGWYCNYPCFIERKQSFIKYFELDQQMTLYHLDRLCGIAHFV